MKKVLLLAVLLTAYSNLFAFLTQGNWRWRKDDGSETTATWLAAQNTAPTITTTDSVLRLRIEVYNTQTSDIGLLDTLQYTTDTTNGPWIDITPVAGSNAFMIAGSSPYVVDSEATTSQLVGVSNSPFKPGFIMVSHEVLYDTLPVDMRTEYEWCIKPTANIQTNTTYYFQHWGSTAQKKKTTPFPKLKTAGVLAIKLSGFKVTPEDKQVKLEWTTASEEYNNRFEIERSSDTRNWKVIGSVMGSGTTSLAHTYQLYDKDPLSGMNYYRIRQYDNNGKSTVSEIKSLRMILANSLVLVYPNPVKGSINFSLKQYAGGDLYITLTSNNGKIIHRETVKDAQAGITYTLNTAKPSAGFYVLHVKGESLSESIKVVVQ